MAYATISFPLLRVLQFILYFNVFRQNALLIYICKYFHCLLLQYRYRQ